jgi:hypothetical protein
MGAWSIMAKSRGSSSRRDLFVCLLLAMLLLYNPFIALLHSGGPVSVHHLARNRATVGAAELQQYSPVSGQDAVEVSIVEESFAIPAGAVRGEFPAAILLVVPRIASIDFSSSLWFRPPPAV